MNDEEIKRRLKNIDKITMHKLSNIERYNIGMNIKEIINIEKQKARADQDKISRADERKILIDYLEKEAKRLQGLRGTVGIDYLSGAINKVLDIVLYLKQLAEQSEGGKE